MDHPSRRPRLSATGSRLLAGALVLVIVAVVAVVVRDRDPRPVAAPRPFIEPVSERVSNSLVRERGGPPPQPKDLTSGRAAPGSEASAAVARGTSYVPGRLIVAFRPDASEQTRARIRGRLGARLLRRLPIPGAELLALPRDTGVEEATRSLARHAEVSYSEPDFVYRAAALTPNDPSFRALWALENPGDTDMDAPEAWAVTTGSKAIRVGVVDTGVAYDHPDLSPNIAPNPGETGGGKETNGLDDDGNGYVDDFRGWDWVGRDNDPRDLNGHGTHVAGTIGAKGGNGIAVTGVSWDVGLVPLRVLDANGSGTSSSIASAFAYAGAMGLDVVNASLGGPSTSQSVLDAINRSPDTLFVAAAGNEAANNDSVASYPCNLQAPNIVCVSATTQSDALASFSNYGATTVDLGAPGSGIVSTVPVSVVVLSETFESGFAERWAAGGTGSVWDLATDNAGSYLADSPGGNYSSSSESTVRTLQSLDLSAVSGCRLRQALRLDTEPGADLLLAEASRDGTTWTKVGSWTGSTGGRWAEVSADLASFTGERSVFLRYRLTSNSNETVGAGADLDDLKVSCIGTSYTGNEVGSFSGTSMAAPQVAGAAALVKSAVPGLDVATLKEALLRGVVAVPALQGRSVTGGRLNVFGSLQQLGAAALPASTPTITPTPMPTQTQQAPPGAGAVPPTPMPTAQPSPSPTPAATPAGPTPAPSPSGGGTAGARSVELTLKKHLVAKVSVSADAESCRNGVPLVLKRNGSVVSRTRTDTTGRADVRLRDRPGRYAALVPATSACARAVDSERHGHQVASSGSPSAEDDVAASGTDASCYRFKPAEMALGDLMNIERAAQGRAPLPLDPELSKVARVHTRKMVARDTLVHSTNEFLSTRVTGWSVLGENIGFGSSVEAMHPLFMGSPPHRDNILSRGFAYAGVGVIRSDGRVWVTVVFEGRNDPGTTLRMPVC